MEEKVNVRFSCQLARIENKFKGKQKTKDTCQNRVVEWIFKWTAIYIFFFFSSSFSSLTYERKASVTIRCATLLSAVRLVRMLKRLATDDKPFMLWLSGCEVGKRRVSERERENSEKARSHNISIWQYISTGNHNSNYPTPREKNPFDSIRFDFL